MSGSKSKFMERFRKVIRRYHRDLSCVFLIIDAKPPSSGEVGVRPEYRTGSVMWNSWCAAVLVVGFTLMSQRITILFKGDLDHRSKHGARELTNQSQQHPQRRIVDREHNLPPIWRGDVVLSGGKMHSITRASKLSADSALLYYIVRTGLDLYDLSCTYMDPFHFRGK